MSCGMSVQRLDCVCVYCGSSSGLKASYAVAARDLGLELAKRQISLVYGGGSVGLMGIIAETVDSSGGCVTGVIPKSLAPEHISGKTPGRVILTETMHERKMRMASRANAFIALPGGIGTLEELFEIATWRQLGHHRKPIGILNVQNYFDPLLEFLDGAVADGFVSSTTRSIFVVGTSASELLNKLGCGLSSVAVPDLCSR